MNSVIAIIVTYFPDRKCLFELIDAIMPQVDKLIIIDNGSPEEMVDFIRQKLYQIGVFISKNYNTGIAEAINTGILESQKLNARYVILFDQDSIPKYNMVDKLLCVIEKREKNGYKIAAVGPNYTDIKGEWDQSPFVKLKGQRLHRVDCGNNLAVSVDHLISSGCLIPMKSLQEIGLMESQLFIDYVDIEWCLRAKHKGFDLFGACSAHMQHDLGNDMANLFGRKIPVHSALRYYYLIRNGIWLLRQPWGSIAWKIADARRIFFVYIACSFLFGTKFKNWKMATIGLWHGLIGKMGKYP